METPKKCSHPPVPKRVAVTDTEIYCPDCYKDLDDHKFPQWMYCPACLCPGTFSQAVRGHRTCLRCWTSYETTEPLRRGNMPLRFQELDTSEMDEV